MPKHDSSKGAGQTGVITRTEPKTRKPSLYKVLLLNDDYTPMEFVVQVLVGVFHKNDNEATQIMLNVHNNGVGVCGEYTAEVAELERQGLRNGRTASRAIGYRQVLSHLAGECTQDEAKQATIQVTRRFARKQLGWLRRDQRIVWLQPGPEAAEAIVSDLQGRLPHGR